MDDTVEESINLHHHIPAKKWDNLPFPQLIWPDFFHQKQPPDPRCARPGRLNSPGVVLGERSGGGFAKGLWLIENPQKENRKKGYTFQRETYTWYP